MTPEEIQQPAQVFKRSIDTFSPEQLYIASQTLINEADKPGAEFVFVELHRQRLHSLANLMREYAQRKFPNYTS